MSKVTNSKKTKRLNALQTLLQKHKDQFQTLTNGKIKCLLTGHQFLPSEQNVVDHLKSKSYKKASQSEFDISLYEDVLITHKDNEHFLFCRLTGAKVPKKKTSIMKHVNGKKFKHRFQQYLKQIKAAEQAKEGELKVVDQDEQNEDDEQIQDDQQAQQQQDDEQEQQVQLPKAKGKHQQNVKVNNKQQQKPSNNKQQQKSSNNKQLQKPSNNKQLQKTTNNGNKPSNNKQQKPLNNGNKPSNNANKNENKPVHNNNKKKQIIQQKKAQPQAQNDQEDEIDQQQKVNNKKVRQNNHTKHNGKRFRNKHKQIQKNDNKNRNTRNKKLR